MLVAPQGAGLRQLLDAPCGPAAVRALVAARSAISLEVPGLRADLEAPFRSSRYLEDTPTFDGGRRPTQRGVVGHSADAVHTFGETPVSTLSPTH